MVEREPPAVVAVALPPLAESSRHARSAPPPPPPASTTRTAPPVSPIVVPSVTPTAIPAPSAAGGDTLGVEGGVPGGTGLAMTPGRGDPRLWVKPLFIPEGGGRPIDMDSVVRRRMVFMADQIDSLMATDSLNPNAPQYAARPWTFQRNGRTYGIDGSGIHFGSFTIPSAVLAFLPFPQGNIDQARANARLMDMRADILRAAARSEAEDDFRRAVAQIRERKDRERREQRLREEQQRQRDRANDAPIP